MRLEIQCKSRIGIAREVLDLFIPYGIDIKIIEVDVDQRLMHIAFPDISFDQLQTLLATIRRIDGVEDVKTVMFTPSEREKNALSTLLKALPDGVISVDIQGNVTMATEIALQDLGVDQDQLLNQPLSKFIKGVRFHPPVSSNSTQIQSKRIRVNSQNMLLEMLPIFVPDQDGQSIPAGFVINLKSEARLDQQTASLRRAPNTELHLSDYLIHNIALSDAMQLCLKRAEAMFALDMPMYVFGSVGVGKEDLINAMYQNWWATQNNMDSKIVWRTSSDVTEKTIEKMRASSGWCVIQSPESLSEASQRSLIRYLKAQSQSNSNFGMRLVTVSHLSLNELRQSSVLLEELFYLISALTLRVPSLSERKEDIAGLADLYVQDVAERLKLSKPKLSKGASIKMQLYSWPGNLNEFRNVCLQAVALNQTQMIGVGDLKYDNEETGTESVELIDDSLDKTMKHWEAKLLKDLYPNYPSSRLLAKKVGLSHSAVANKLREYGIGHAALTRKKVKNV
ncbi:TyrR/PhhR family helix-turn-helix DNA-binding protein [Marinomonas sp. 2405UD68-3]|uniref:TyrR/PhhR family helix-turn-helix DNA-binding protein n=1 Tax=Marinomonas sp. 2405UD68-3 TaxID=3391835 RepID=UPI0039C95375